MERSWFEEHVVAPMRGLAAILEPGVVATEVPGAVELAVEGLLRLEVPFRWRGWPPEASSDGTSVDLAWRRSDTTITVAGRVWLLGVHDGMTTAVRVDFAETGEGPAATVAFGDVDPHTGGLFVLPKGTVLLRGDDDDPPVPHRIDHRRLVPVVWTDVATIRLNGLNA